MQLTIKCDDANCVEKNRKKFHSDLFHSFPASESEFAMTCRGQLLVNQEPRSPFLITVICDNHLPLCSAFQTLPEGRLETYAIFLTAAMVSCGSHDRPHPATHTNTNKTQTRTWCRGQKGLAASKPSAPWKLSDLFNSHGESLEAFSTQLFIHTANLDTL